MTKLLFIQYGDYAEAWHRLRSGGPETYRDQRASVDLVAGLADRFDVTTLAVADKTHSLQLAPGLWSIGIEARDFYASRRLSGILDGLAPDLVVLRTPSVAALSWAVRRGRPTLPCFADLFERGGLRGRIGQLRLRRLLAQPNVPGVANHSLNASLSVADVLRLPRDRVVPWDWSRLSMRPGGRAAAARGAEPRAFFAGLMIEAKGVGDCLETVQVLQRRGIALHFTFAGKGDLDFWRARAAELGVQDRVTFLGVIAHDAVRAAMEAHDMVIVASRPAYAEGFPNTIYEALAARTPLLVSDHPAFAGRLHPGKDSLVFRAGDPSSMAGQIAALLSDAGLRDRLTDAAEAAHAALYIGLAWSDLVGLFVQDPHDRAGWVAAHSLTALKL